MAEKAFSLFKTTLKAGFILFLACIFTAFFYSNILKKYFFFKSEQVEKQGLPFLAGLSSKLKHLAVIMDGNRRWAKKRSFSPWQGHKAGAEKLGVAVDFCLKNGIQDLSVYAFSVENLKRSEKEKNEIFSLISNQSESLIKRSLEKGIRVRVFGEKEYFPEKVLSCVEKIEEKTSELKNLNLNILFMYGGRQEIISAIKKMAKNLEDGTLSANEITDVSLKENMWTSDLSDPDLIIRTGGRNRVSNFFTWQSAYSEIKFLDKFWPEIEEVDFQQCCKTFLEANRTFGS